MLYQVLITDNKGQVIGGTLSTDNLEAAERYAEEYNSKANTTYAIVDGFGTAEWI